jgi:hypothetical protein
MQLSSSWLWLAAGLYLLFEVWRGWRRGVVRHGVSVMALITAGGVGWIFAWMTGPLSNRVVPLPEPVGRILFGLAAAVAFYVAAVVLSSLLFRRTAQQPPGPRRLVYGLGGSFFGLLFGLVILWGGISLVRTLGAVHAAQSMDPPPATAEAPAGEQWIDRIDIVPVEVYRVLTKLLRVTRDPQTAARFFAYPATQELFSQPKLVELFNDPALTDAASGGSYLGLLTNPKLAEVARDPAVQQSFASFDWEKALDYALQESAPSPVPSP